MANTVVTRFAPSPTGYLHVGGARTALFSWLLARHSGGKFYLRIEDTDLARSTQSATEQLLEDLRWLGLHWDNAELMFQSRRKPVYDAIIDGLIERGLAYKAWETTAELDAARKAADKGKLTYIYRRPQLTDAQVKQFESEGRPHVVRFATPVKEYRFDDLVLGPGQGVDASQVQDFVIRKSDGMPTYHFAVVVDDAEMGITHILRGQEHLLNTVNHIALQEALQYPTPACAHLPIILNLDSSKMGKRDRDKKIREATNNNWMKAKKPIAELASLATIPVDRLEAWIGNSKSQLEGAEQLRLMPWINLKPSDLPEILVHDFRANGFLPDALLNFLALLGWNPGGDRETMTRSELVDLFEIFGIGKSNSKFDREKLLAFNTAAGAKLDGDEAIKIFREYLAVNADSSLNKATDAQLLELIKMKHGFRLLRDVDEASRFLFIDDSAVVFDPPAVEKVLRKQGGLDVLQKLLPELESAHDWSHDPLEKLFNDFGQRNNLALGKVAQPVRVAVSGGTISPPIFSSLAFLGKPSTLARIRRAIEHTRAM